MFQYKQFYVCASVGVLIKCLYEMHGATTKTPNFCYLPYSCPKCAPFVILQTSKR